jgi:3-hydroxybutyryl-CoA dehydratase
MSVETFLKTDVAGQKLPSCMYHVDQLLVDRYAEVSGDYNPLHTDPAFAAGTHFGRTIAHGMMTLAFVADAIDLWAGKDWARDGGMDVAFLSPVFPNDDVTVEGRISNVSATGTVTCELTCLAGERKILAGTVHWQASGDGDGAA